MYNVGRIVHIVEADRASSIDPIVEANRASSEPLSFAFLGEGAEGLVVHLGVREVLGVLVIFAVLAVLEIVVL